MAITLTAKPSGAVYRYTWEPPLADGDVVESYTLTETGCTIDSDALADNAVVFFVSAGTAGAVASIEAEAVTADGETLTETLYIPIRDNAASAGNTVSDVVNFALRPVVGFGIDADADLMAHGLEIFNDMVSEWRIDGLDVGIPQTSALSDTLTIRDEFLAALKWNLRIKLGEEFGLPLRPAAVQSAARSRLLVENALFQPNPLTFEPALQQPRVMTGIDDL